MQDDAHTLRGADKHAADLSAHPQIAIMRASPVAIALTSADSDLIVEVNAAFERLFKVIRAQVIGRSLLAMFGASSPLARLMTLVHSEGSVRDLEGHAQTESGEPLTLSLCAEIAQLAQARCVITFLQDISVRRALEEALRASEDNFARMFHESPYGMSIVDLERDCYVDVNEGFARLFGVRREHVVGRSVSELALWADPEERQRYFEAVRTRGLVRDMPIHCRRSGGAILVGEASGLVVKIGERRCLITFAIHLSVQQVGRSEGRSRAAIAL